MRLLKSPVLCNYYVTYRCNAACSFCDIWEIPSPYVTIEQVERNLRDLKQLGVKVIDFTGGEPLLHRQLPQFLKLAKDLGFITTVTTNTLLYPKMAEALRGLVDMLHFSLDSIDPATHNASRNVDCFASIERSIAIAKELGERPDILFTVRNENVNEIAAVVKRFAQDEGLIVILNPIFGYNQVGEELSEESLAELDKWTHSKNVYLNKAFLDLRRRGGNHVNAPVCKAGDTTIVISPENKLIQPCYHLKVDEISLDDGLLNVLSKKEVQQGRAAAGKLPECEGCTVNCYMEPSMAVELNRHWPQSLESTVKYALEKWVY
jgi:MoaA/NifB/PqqE/SkfB family radical SAM enzyme